MIPGKKCRHLNREAVDIGGGEGKVRSIYLTGSALEVMMLG
jgi:hypothetical protein